MKEVICKGCGKKFQGNDTTVYCIDCRLENPNTKGTESGRIIGATDKCAICGKEYTITASKQKYCPECVADGKAVQPYHYTKAEGKAKGKWRQKAYDRCELNLPKGFKQVVADHAAKHNESINQFINRAVQNQIELDNAKDS